MLATLTACQGVIGEPGAVGGRDNPGDRGEGPASPSDTPPSPTDSTSPRGPDAPPIGLAPPGSPDDSLCLNAPAEAGAGRLRHLTQLQYANTVRDLLGIQLSDTSESADSDVGGFPANAGDFVGAQHATRFQLSAESLAEGADLERLLDCDASNIDSNCASRFVESFGRRAYRRPLSAEEISRYEMLFEAGRTEQDAEDGVRRVIAAMLQSPYFLYLVELGETGEGLFRLTGYELASRMSYLLWNSMPDEALLTAAPQLANADTRREQARRMLQDSNAQRSVMRFFEHWLGIDEIQNAPLSDQEYPEFDDDFADDLRGDLLELIRRVVFEGDAKLSTLLSATHSYPSAAMRETYGLPEPAADGRVQWPTSERSGLLTHPAVLAVHGRQGIVPVARGLFIRRKIFCQGVPSPPADVDISAPEENGGNPREQWSEHVANPTCASCHNYIDPLGWPFEEFDQLGRHREQYEGWTIESHGELVGTDVDGVVSGAVELSQRIAESQYVQACVAQHFFVYAHGREVSDIDECALREITTAFADSGGDLKQLLVELIGASSFEMRRVDVAQ